MTDEQFAVPSQERPGRDYSPSMAIQLVFPCPIRSGRQHGPKTGIARPCEFSLTADLAGGTIARSSYSIPRQPGRYCYQRLPTGHFPAPGVLGESTMTRSRYLAIA